MTFCKGHGMLTILSKTTESAAAAVKKAATTIIMAPTALLEPITAMAEIQPLKTHQTSITAGRFSL